MTEHSSLQATVVGSGPNGLAASIRLAEAGIPVTVYEKNSLIGGGCRSAELIESGYMHDLGSAVHPMAIVSPLFKRLRLQDHGLNWITPPAAVAHPFDDGTAVLITKSVTETAMMLDDRDRKAYSRLMGSFVDNWLEIADDVMHFPRIPFRHPSTLMRFGYRAMQSAVGLARSVFYGERARALIGGLGAHSVMVLEHRASAAAGITLGIAGHTTGWPIPQGGAQSITNALSSYLNKLGGEIIADNQVRSIDSLSPYDLIMLDVTPHQFLQMAKQHLPESYKRKLANYRYGPGIFKLDWILDGPVPWKAKECLNAATVHVGGSLEEIADAERSAWYNGQTEKPFVILVQPTLFDHTRAKDGRQIVWAYSHVPNGSNINMTGRIESQIERFAPGFQEKIVARYVSYPSELEKDNPNCIGGDITGGTQSMRRLIFPELSYATPIPNVFLCSSSTPPGPGVHGICGDRSVQLALKKMKVT